MNEAGLEAMAAALAEREAAAYEDEAAVDGSEAALALGSSWQSARDATVRRAATSE